MPTPYQEYIKNFSKLPRNKLQRIVDSKPQYPSPFLPRKNLYYKAAENSLKSRNMNRSRHNLPEFLIDKVILDELKKGKLDLSYFQKILDNDKQDTVKREEAIRTLKTIRKILSSDIPGLLISRGLIFDVLLATAIGGDIVSILYTRRELIQKIDILKNNIQ